MDYKKLKMEDMIQWIEENHNDKKSKAAFKAVAVQQSVESKLVKALDDEGNPIKYINKAGKEVYKMKRVEKKDGKAIERPMTLSAKAYFYETYKDEIDFINAPQKKQKSTVLDMLADW